jgi:hypothetical protein
MTLSRPLLLPLILAGGLVLEHGHPELLAIMPGEYSTPAHITQDSTSTGAHHLPAQSAGIIVPST